jgi:hypothetical protein
MSDRAPESVTQPPPDRGVKASIIRRYEWATLDRRSGRLDASLGSRPRSRFSGFGGAGSPSAGTIRRDRLGPSWSTG